MRHVPSDGDSCAFYVDDEGAGGVVADNGNLDVAYHSHGGEPALEGIARVNSGEPYRASGGYHRQRHCRLGRDFRVLCGVGLGFAVSAEVSEFAGDIVAVSILVSYKLREIEEPLYNVRTECVFRLAGGVLGLRVVHSEDVDEE